MDAAKIKELLTDAGFRVLDAARDAIIVEDPTCILRNLSDFIDFAWIALGCLAAILLFGWAVALIRAAEIDIVDNLKNLFLLFAGLAIVPALISFLMSKELLQCRRLSVSVSDINNVLVLKSASFDFGNNTVEAHDGAASNGAVYDGTINGLQVLDARTELSESDMQSFQRVINNYGLRIRGCEAEGCGSIGAHRSSGPPIHEGTDLYRAPGAPIPALFSGTIAEIDRTRYGDVFTGITVNNDNGTTSYYLYAADQGISVGNHVNAGDVIATSQDLAAYPEYANVPNHVHFELWNGRGRRIGNVISTESLF